MIDERGVTLVETLAAVSITAVVGSALAFAIVTGLRTTDQTRVTVLEAQDAQLTAAVFEADVQSAESVSTTEASCAGGAPIVHLGSTDGTSSVAVAYRARTVGDQRVLTRYECVDGGAATTRDVARSVDADAGPSIACLPGACGADPETIVLTVTQESGSTFDVTAVRRPA